MSLDIAPEPVTAETPEKPATRGMFINRGFALLWAGQSVSTLGNFIFDTTLIVWVAATLARSQTWAPLAVSGVVIAAALPPLLLAPLAGVIVDRVSKRGAMLVSDALRTLIALSLLPLTGLVTLPLFRGSQGGLWTLGAIYVAVAALAVCGQFFSPAALALVGALVGEEQQPKAMGLMQGASSLAMLVGPAVAPPLLLTFGPRWALLINAASFGVSFLTLLAIRAPADTAARPARASVGRELREGVTCLLRSRILRTLTLVTGMAMLGAGALNALDVFFTIHNLRTPLTLYGTLNTTLGVGLIVGAVAAGALAQRIGLGRVVGWSVVAIGALVMVYARLDSFIPALVVLFFLGVPLAATSVASGPMLLRETPARLVGRIESLITSVTTVATLAGAGLAGWLDSGPLRDFSARLLGASFGPVDTIYLAGGALILLSGLYALRGLRQRK